MIIRIISILHDILYDMYKSNNNYYTIYTCVTIDNSSNKYCMMCMISFIIIEVLICFKIIDLILVPKI